MKKNNTAKKQTYKKNVETAEIFLSFFLLILAKCDLQTYSIQKLHPTTRLSYSLLQI